MSVSVALPGREEIRPGDDVAARIHTKEGINWILAKVREARANGKYDVLCLRLLRDGH